MRTPWHSINRRALARVVAGWLVVVWIGLGLAGCSEKKPQKPAKAAEPTASAKIPDALEAATEPVASATPTEAKPGTPPTPAADQQVCFQCQGTGQMTCKHTGCDHGFVECPGPCLKRSSKWEHAVVAGFPADELWHVIPLPNGRQYVSQAHIGEVFVVRNGQVDRLGKCPTCNGRGHLPCPTCGGKARVTCDLCEGRKVIPSAWKTNDNPVLNRQPDLIRLKDGRVFLGKRSELGERAFIRTRDGQFITVGKDDFEEAATK